MIEIITGKEWNPEIETNDYTLPDHICVKVAAELERQLLPKTPIYFDGAEIAGWTIYSSSLGGDFFDYHGFEGVCCSASDHMRIVVGDASGHGICSSLMMTSARAYLRARALQSGPLNQVADDVNQLLCLDTGDSGHFVTAFIASVLGKKREIRWVRAGHEPALLYNPKKKIFESLAGKGIALGVDPHFHYKMNSISGLANGTIIIIASDGLWETKHGGDATFGKDMVRDVIWRYRHAGAAIIADAIKASILDYFKDSNPEDDMTLVVIKFM